MILRFRRRSFLRSRCGFSTVIATIFMVLAVVFLFFNVYLFMQNQDAKFQDAVSQSQQLDADHSSEVLTVSGVLVNVGSNGALNIGATLSNNGSLPVQIVRLWVEDKDLTLNNIGNIDLATPPLILKPGVTIQQTFPTINIAGALSGDSFYLWAVTSRGNSFPITAKPSSQSSETDFILTVSASSGGTTEPTPGLYSIPQGTQVTIIAYPDSGYQLDYWLVDNTQQLFPGTSTVAQGFIIQPTMYQDRSIEAVFKPSQ